MKKYILLIPLLLFVFVSCGKKEESGGSGFKIPDKVGKSMKNTFRKVKSAGSGALNKTKAAGGNTMYLKNKVNTFQRQEGRYPSSLQELVQKRYINEIPPAPKGMRFVYDSRTGKVTAE